MRRPKPRQVMRRRLPRNARLRHYRRSRTMVRLRGEHVTQPPALSLSKIGKRYGSPPNELVVLDEVSFDVRRGEIISLIGPSGCGKTTLFNIAGGLLGDHEGSVLVDGNSHSPRRRIGMVFQEESNFPWRTTLQNVALPLEAAGVGRRERLEKARHFIHLVGLDGFEDRYPDELSGGMRQRAAIARTLAFGAKILLMDEPFAALDSQTRILIGDKILEICRELEQTMLLITHNLTEAVQLSDRVVVMTRRPGRVKCIVDIDLPRPRSSDILGSARFAELVGAVWHELRAEANLAMLEGQIRRPSMEAAETGQG
jgi:NitT/TauT family transport system ATP-binding protein